MSSTFYLQPLVGLVDYPDEDSDDDEEEETLAPSAKRPRIGT